MQNYTEIKSAKKEYTFSIIEGRERILQIMRQNHRETRKHVRGLTTLDRWMQILTYCFEEYKKGLVRKVKYHVVIQMPRYNFVFPKRIRELIVNANFQLKFTYGSLQSNIGIFDSKYATFNFFPAKSFADSPVLYTNHPSFLSMAQDHFEKVWESAEEYKL